MNDTPFIEDGIIYIPENGGRIIRRIGEKIMDNQEIKADANKPKISLVPLQILKDVARVREFALKKYKSANSWKNVEIERYRDAMLRHMIAYIENPKGVDEESGLPHLSHLACNIAFLCEMEKENAEHT